MTDMKPLLEARQLNQDKTSSRPLGLAKQTAFLVLPIQFGNKESVASAIL